MLLPLDEVPVHVPLRRPRPLRFERLPVPVWNPYSRGRLSPAKSEDRKGGEGKTDANLKIFFSAWSAFVPPTRRHALGRLPTPPPLPENLLLGLHRKLPSVPLRARRRFRNPKIGQQLGAQPTPRYRWRYRWRFRRCFSRSTRFPFTSTPSPPAPLAIRKAPSASVESIQPRPPRPCEVGRPKGRRRKNRRQSHTFF